jgi:hypothetical protein
MACATYETEFKYAKSVPGLIAQKKELREARSRVAEAQSRAISRFKRLQADDPAAAAQLQKRHNAKLVIIQDALEGFDRMIQECRNRIAALKGEG